MLYRFCFNVLIVFYIFCLTVCNTELIDPVVSNDMSMSNPLDFCSIFLLTIKVYNKLVYIRKRDILLLPNKSARTYSSYPINLLKEYISVRFRINKLIIVAKIIFGTSSLTYRNYLINLLLLRK